MPFPLTAEYAPKRYAVRIFADNSVGFPHSFTVVPLRARKRHDVKRRYAGLKNHDFRCIIQLLFVRRGRRGSGLRAAGGKRLIWTL